MSESSRLPSVTYSAAKITALAPVTSTAATTATHVTPNSRPVTVVSNSNAVSIPTVTRISFTPAAAAAAAAAAGGRQQQGRMSGQQQQQPPQQQPHLATLSPAVVPQGAGVIKVEPRLNGYGMQEMVSQQQVPAAAAHMNLNQAGTAVLHEDSKDWQNEQQCCLIENGRRCGKPAGNASYSKRIQKTVTQKKLKLYMDNRANHIYICDYHKNMIQTLRGKRKRKDSEDDSGETDSEHPEVDLYQLQVNTLRRYKKHYKVSSRPGLNKAQLADNLMHHFKTIPVQEKEALTYFIYMIKTNKSKLDRERREEHD